MSAAVSLPPAPTAMALRAAGVVFKRNERGTITGGKAAPDERAVIAREIERRVAQFTAMLRTCTERPAPLLVITPTTERSGACLSCADPMEGWRSGQCELCEVALGRALRAVGRL